jgi:hypothetical protein
LSTLSLSLSSGRRKGGASSCIIFSCPRLPQIGFETFKRYRNLGRIFTVHGQIQYHIASLTTRYVPGTVPGTVHFCTNRTVPGTVPGTPESPNRGLIRLRLLIRVPSTPQPTADTPWMCTISRCACDLLPTLDTVSSQIQIQIQIQIHHSSSSCILLLVTKVVVVVTNAPWLWNPK